MSQENVKLALAVADTWNRGDHEAFLALWDEEAVRSRSRASCSRRVQSLALAGLFEWAGVEIEPPPYGL